ncbi:unnamed protein product [Caenorhabditis angaria]|uniref:Potassium channel domain-containing protein n=1 Tax=Caenorhabditis angaria TaxID=860376 RepID=A0A9P1IC22_9PELO|nr:unnamed protein product [Caenorhabditis angaria]
MQMLQENDKYEDFSSSCSFESTESDSKSMPFSNEMSSKTQKKFENLQKILVLIIVGNLLILLNFIGAFIFLLAEYFEDDKNHDDFSHSECLKNFETIENLDICLKKASKIDTFSRAFFYCWTLYSTVGYGNIYPRSTVGKIATIIYSSIVIPVYISFKFEIGTYIAYLMIFVSNKIGKFLNWTRDYLILLSSFLSCLTLVLLSSVYFSIIEKISYFSSIYFSIISMNLIGLGDIAPVKTFYFIIGYFPCFLILDVFSSHFFYFGQARIRQMANFIAQKILWRPKKSQEISIEKIPIINTQCMPMNVLDCEDAEISLLQTAREASSIFE